MPRKNAHAVALGKLTSKRKNVASAANGRRSKGRPPLYRVVPAPHGQDGLTLQHRHGEAWQTAARLSVLDLSHLARVLRAHAPEVYVTRIEGGTVYYDPV